MLIVICGFCRDGNVTIGLTATMDGGDDFQSIFTKIFSIFLKLFPIKLFSKVFSLGVGNEFTEYL